MPELKASPLTSVVKERNTSFKKTPMTGPGSICVWSQKGGRGGQIRVQVQPGLQNEFLDTRTTQRKPSGVVGVRSGFKYFTIIQLKNVSLQSSVWIPMAKICSYPRTWQLCRGMGRGSQPAADKPAPWVLNHLQTLKRGKVRQAG